MRSAVTDLNVIFTALYLDIDPDLCSLLEQATKKRKARTKKRSPKGRGPRGRNSNSRNPRRKTNKKGSGRRRR